ncbi:MAG: carbohydrate kinase family protein, partial [Thermoguttaceae bacterium]
MIDEAIFRGSRLCVVGNICRDVKTAPIGADERLLRDGETATKFIVETIGGGGANSALFAAGLGAESRFAGKVGADALGAKLEQTLLGRGVMPFLRHDPAIQTGSSLVLTYANGCRHFISHQPNNDTLDFSDIDFAMLAGGGHLLRADIWFSQLMLAGGNAQLLQAARDRGLATSLDLNWDPCWGYGDEELIQSRKESVRQILQLVDLVHVNVNELNLFADSTDLANTVQQLTAWGAGAVVVHKGAQGAGYYCGGELIVEPSVPIRQHVNATGCGDLLSVCMMLLHEQTGIPISEKLRLANRIVAQFIEGKRDLLPR